MSVQATRVSYSGMFDRSIYDQSELSPHATEIELKNHLIKKKLEKLNTAFLNHDREQLEKLKKNVKRGIPYFADKEFNGVAQGIINPSAASFVNLPGFEQVANPIEGEEAKKAAFELANKIELNVKGLEKELIGDLEHKYIVKKKDIPSQELKDEIEDSLLLTRNSEGPIQYIKEFIENALRLPNSIFPAANIDITANNKIRNYNRGLQFRLRCIAQKFIADSLCLDSRDTCNRSIYYFYGNPSSGKSTAAKLIPELLDLPFLVYTIRSGDDLSRGNLEGMARAYWEANNPGLLGCALLSQNSTRKSYLNSVLILEDIDRILFSDNGNASLAFLLDFLDPEKKDFKSPYFHSKINIAWLSIIMTSNQKIPQKPEKPGEKDTYAALRSRVSEVYFRDFADDNIQSTSESYAERMGNKYGIAQETIQANKSKWVDNAIQKQEKQSDILELRDLKRRIEEEVIEESLNQRQRRDN